jgi:hypothetical protein
MPLSKRKQEEVAETPIQKRKLDEAQTEEITTEVAPAKKRCLPLSIKMKLEEAERRKQKEAEVSKSSASDDSSDSESDSPTAKKKTLLDFFAVKAASKK